MPENTGGNSSSGYSGGGMGLVGPILQFGGQAMNNAWQDRANRDARNFALMQGDIEWERRLKGWQLQNERDDMLWTKQNSYNEYLWNMQNAYNKQMWDMQNAYNSPAAQMQRYKEAGLNPNLIYGQSNTGGSISTASLDSSNYNSGSAPTGGRPSNWNPVAPNIQPLDVLSSYVNLKEQAVRTSNLEQLNQVYKQEVVNKQLQGLETIANTEGKNINNKLARELATYQLDAAIQNLAKTKQEMWLDLQRNNRENQALQNQTRSTDSQLKLNESTLQNHSQERELRELDIELRRMGINPNDNMLFRILGRMWNSDWRKDNIPTNLDKKTPSRYHWNGNSLMFDYD